jgi:hypothetical protein
MQSMSLWRNLGGSIDVALQGVLGFTRSRFSSSLHERHNICIMRSVDFLATTKTQCPCGELMFTFCGNSQSVLMNKTDSLYTETGIFRWQADSP